jgi:hypothetical protein
MAHVMHGAMLYLVRYSVKQPRSFWLLFEQLPVYPWTQLFSSVAEALCLTDSSDGLSQCIHSVSPCVEDIRAVAVCFML